MALDPCVAAIVERLKERAAATPWVPFGVAPQEHYHRFSNGLSLCFTLDVLPAHRYWHLSIAGGPGGATPEEIEFWRRAFFDEEPTLTYPGLIPSGALRHFFWRIPCF